MVINLLRELSDEMKSTLVIVTHDEFIASQFKQQFVLGDGKLIS